MLKFKYSTNEINNYINSLNRDEIISIGNSKYGLLIHEDYIETSYEWFEHDVSRISLISKIDENHFASINIFDWLRQNSRELKPTTIDGFESLMNSIINSPSELKIPDNIYNELLEDEKDKIRRIKEDEFSKKLYSLDKKAPFSIEYGEETKYFLYFDKEGKDLSPIIKYLNSKPGEEFESLKQEAIEYLKEYSKEAYDEYINSEKESSKDILDCIKPNKIISFEMDINLKDGTYFHFHPNDEGYYYAIMNQEDEEIDGGLLEYSLPFEDEESLKSILKRLNDFTGIEELISKDLDIRNKSDIEPRIAQFFIDEATSNQYNTSDKERLSNLKNNTLFVSSLNSNELTKKYDSYNSLEKDTIEYLYDENTNCIIYQTWKGNVIVPGTDENINIIGKQFFYKLTNDIRFNQELYEEERNMKEGMNQMEENPVVEESRKYTNKKGKVQRTKNFKEFSEKEKLRYNDITNQLIQNFDDLIMFNTKRYFEFVRCQNQFNMANYSFRNKTWLWNQATIQNFIPYFATFKEWNKNDLSVKAGEHGMAILIPFKNKTTYFVKVNEAGDNDGILPETLSEEELKNRNMKLSEDGHLLKKIEVQEFFQKQCIFSISQTTATPDMIPDIYKTYNTEATSDENNHILEKLKKFLEKMDIKYIENKELNSLLLNGQNAHYWNGEKQIQVKEELPTDAKIMVLSHEIGHELMKHLDKSDLKQFNLDHENKEIQAQLFSDMLLDYLHIDTQNLYSKDYIEGYLKLTSQTPFWRNEETWRKLKASQLLANVEAVDPIVSLFKEAYEQDFQDISKIENRSILHIAKNKDEYGIAREKREVNNASKNEFKEVKQNEINGMEME